MNSKLEKYINYIVDDLIKDTYQSDHDTVTTPVRYEGDGDNYILRQPYSEDILYLFNESTNFQPDLYLLLIEKYGIHDDDWVFIKERYRDSLLKKYPY
jgi:hypothetical protein